MKRKKLTAKSAEIAEKGKTPGKLFGAEDGLTLEFKRANDRLPSNFLDTVCAFLNMDGGLIVLGMEDDATNSQPRMGTTYQPGATPWESKRQSAKALKGRHIPARGNALGIETAISKGPERATYTSPGQRPGFWET